MKYGVCRLLELSRGGLTVRMWDVVEVKDTEEEAAKVAATQPNHYRVKPVELVKGDWRVK